jgi:hypothetical protein
MYEDIDVKLEGDSLVATMGPSYTGDLSHWHFDTFKVTWRDPSLGSNYFTFVLGADGKVKQLRTRGMGDFERIPDDRPANAGAP